MIQFEQVHPPDTVLAMSPEEPIKEFLKLFREVKPRYEEAVRQQELHERELNDLLHYAELHTDLNACDGSKLYRRIAESRRQRRICKTEAELLEPLYQYASKSSFLIDQLSGVQGKTTGIREKIERRVYHPRTDILEGLPE